MSNGIPDYCIFKSHPEDLSEKKVRRKVGQLARRHRIRISVSPEEDPELRYCVSTGVRYDAKARLARIVYTKKISVAAIDHEIGHVRHHHLRNKYPRPVGHNRDEKVVAAWVSSLIKNIDLAAREPAQMRGFTEEIQCALTCGVDFSDMGHLAQVFAVITAKQFSLLGLPGTSRVLNMIETKYPGTLDKAARLPVRYRRYGPEAYREAFKLAATTLGFESLHFHDEECPLTFTH